MISTKKNKMKNWVLLLLLLLVFLLKVEEKVVKGENEFITTKGVKMWLNGNPFYGNGFNAYWLMYEGSDPSERHKVSSVFQEASNHGLTIARTWAFSDGGYRPLQYFPGFYNEQMFQVYISVFVLKYTLFFVWEFMFVFLYC